LRAHLAINLLFEVKRVLSQMPIKVERVSKKLLDCEILRVAIIAELDAINLYEQLAASQATKTSKRCFWKLLGKRRPTSESFKRSS
jgi:rubrerythrin